MKDAFFTAIELLGGLGLFLYGMKIMGEGLENSAGDKLKGILEKVTNNRFIGVIVGAVVTAIVQSSSATTVMVVGFVNAGLMSLIQAAGVIMGANVGTTITAQLVAFKLTDYAPLFIAVGAIIVIAAKAKKRKELGNVILGFGLLFLGMAAMSGAMKPLASSPIFKQLVLAIGDNTFIGIVVGLGMTAVLQSSSATTGILISLATAGAINIDAALPILFGCNIGTCVTALLACIGTTKAAKKAALIHLLFNVVGTVIFIPFIGILGRIVQELSPGEVARQVANAHTVFNITATVVIFPFMGLIIKLVNKMIPGDDEIEKVGPKFIDDKILETPVIAAGQVIKETIRMANKAKKNLELSKEAFDKKDENLVKKVYENEEIINVLEEAITDYLVKLSKLELSDKEKNIVTSTFHVVSDIERIGDHAENIAELALQRSIKNLSYSELALKELDSLYADTVNALETSIEAYENRNIQRAEAVYHIENRIDSQQKEYRNNHIARLNEGKCSAFEGAIFMDLLSNLERIGDHATNIADSVIQNAK
ncbi:MAG: Na/Pi cotransporter family protein [Sarcina sp.]